MTEADAIGRSERPATVESLVADLRGLGLEAGQVVLVHSSLSALGWVAGGAQAVLMALMEVLTDSGTLVMPAYSSDNSDPAHWQDPPVPEAWWQVIRDHMPAFNRKLTPSRRLGAIPELFRTAPDVRRSDHPSTSFCAWGRYAHAITADHRLNSSFGEESPLARVYDFDGLVLQLGVGHDTNSSLHLAEHRAEWGSKRSVKAGAAVELGHGRQWVQFEGLHYDSADFARIGAEFEASARVSRGNVACAESKLMRQRPLVDFGAQWMAANRK
ncbi:MAG: AAC(3) family N-acetyltransferase [Planctomycetes bacterium]|nr:AAC(3) family N-acetyltransferase [Planctomycetota bacterium]